MKTIVLVAVTAAVLAIPAQAKAPGFQKQITALRAQVTALNAQVRTLRSQDASVERQTAAMQTALNAGSGYDHTTRDWTVCLHAIDVDNLQQQLHLIYLLSVAVGARITEPVATRYDDRGACARSGINR